MKVDPHQVDEVDRFGFVLVELSPVDGNGLVSWCDGGGRVSIVVVDNG